MRKTVLIFGYGYTAKYIAQELIKNNYIVYGTSRKPSVNDEFDAQEIKIIKYDFESINKILSQVNYIIISVPPDENGDIVLKDFSNILMLAKNIQWIGYLSSTAVYGNHDGKIIDENSELKISSARSKLRALAEKQWHDFGFKKNACVNIFRLAGIYGIGRNALESVKAGTAQSIYKKDHVFSRIHVQDITQVVVSAMKTDDKFEIYNVADDEPCSTIEVNNYAAKLLNVNAPKIIDIKDAVMSIMMQEFYADNKRICNKKIKNKLKIKLNFPDYRAGLDDIFASVHQK
ncbi:MAG: SDR family NAD(P)-dependent oxidoreductase [Rickettsiales bacterium]|nr:MAG: SDR family NAD(P)-dependent oxidoreductase [Rickettsiales bacterium]